MFEAGETAKSLFYDPNDDWQQEIESSASPVMRKQVGHLEFCIFACELLHAGDA